MELIFATSLSYNDIRPGDCLVELPIDEEDNGDRFAILPDGIVCLGHHAGKADFPGSDVFGLTCSAWQAYLLVLAFPGWSPKRIFRPIRPVNLDDVMACMLVNTDTRKKVLSLRSFHRLINEIACADVLGPVGYTGLEREGGGKSLVNRMKTVVPPVQILSEQNSRGRYSDLERAVLSIDLSSPESSSALESQYRIVRDDGLTVLVESTDPGAMKELYKIGYTRVILIQPPHSEGRRFCTVGVVNPLGLGDNGLLSPNREIDWSRVNRVEPGWGGRTAIGGGPREGTRLSDEALWDLFAVLPEQGPEP